MNPFLLIEMPLFVMLRLMKDLHAIGYNTFVVVTMVIAPVPCFPIALDHIVLSFVINFVETPLLKDILVIAACRNFLVLLQKAGVGRQLGYLAFKLRDLSS